MGFDAEEIERLLAHAQHADRLSALLFVDLDQFKQVNDTLGHPCGDQLLCAVANRLREMLRMEDFVARFGGDEFVVFQQNIATPEDAAVLARSGMSLAELAALHGQLHRDLARLRAEFPELTDPDLLRVRPYWRYLHGGSADGDAAFAFDVVAVHRAFRDGLVLAERPRLLQQLVDQRGLAVVNMGDDGDVADIHEGRAVLIGKVAAP